MKRILSLAVLATMPFALAACDSADMALSKALGVKVSATLEGDSCVTKQVETLLNDFGDLSSREQDAFKQKIQRYGEIVFPTTEPRQFLTGTHTELHYFVESCRRHEVCEEHCYERDSWGRHERICGASRGTLICHEETVCETKADERKVIEDHIAVSGSDAPVITVKDKVTISVSRLDDRVHRNVYRTSNRALYQQINSAQDEAFKQALESRAFGEEYGERQYSCGAAIGIKALEKFL